MHRSFNLHNMIWHVYVSKLIASSVTLINLKGRPPKNKWIKTQNSKQTEMNNWYRQSKSKNSIKLVFEYFLPLWC